MNHCKYCFPEDGEQGRESVLPDQRSHIKFLHNDITYVAENNEFTSNVNANVTCKNKYDKLNETYVPQSLSQECCLSTAVVNKLKRREYATINNYKNNVYVIAKSRKPIVVLKHDNDDKAWNALARMRFASAGRKTLNSPKTNITRP